MTYQKLKGIPSWRKLDKELKSNKVLARKLGFEKNTPCHDTFSAFTMRLGSDTFALIFKCLAEGIRNLLPGVGSGTVAIDSTLIEAYSRWPPRRKQPTDPDARFVRYDQKSGPKVQVFGYKMGIICDAKRDLPLNFVVVPANNTDMRLFRGQVRGLIGRDGYNPDAITGDAGYDSKENTLLCLHFKAKPVLAMNRRSKREGYKRLMDGILPVLRDTQEWKRIYSMRISAERVF